MYHNLVKIFKTLVQSLTSWIGASIRFFLTTMGILWFTAYHAAGQEGPIPTSVERTIDGGYTFMRNGSPYYVRGAGGIEYIADVARFGGNSIRTWSHDNAKEILDEAHRHGITVMMGLWVQHERHGFDYDNAERVASQLEMFSQVIDQLKDHPALLAWSVGNEVDLNYSNTNVWYAVEDIAAMIQRKDPNHPVTTITAGLDSTEVFLIKERCPSLDFYGINTYGDLDKLPSQIERYGWTGPYMITEWGPNGHWEVARANWGAPIEQTSGSKAESYGRRYAEKIYAERRTCLGSYAFLWGQKQETTSTWYGLHTEKGKPTETLWSVSQSWQGHFSQADRIPAPASIVSIGGAPPVLRAGEKVAVPVDFMIADRVKGAKLWYEILPESTDIKSGGDAESRPPSLAYKSLGRMKPGTYRGNPLAFRTPSKPGPYRIFVYLEAEGFVAYGNLPFFVEPRGPQERPSRALEFMPIPLNDQP